MKKILAFGASSSKNSINQKLAEFTARATDEEVEIIELADYEMPLYSVDKEHQMGIPQEAKDLKSKIQDADAIVISFAEHNGMVSTAFKNVYDWISRLGHEVWAHKPMFLLATSPGGRGGATVLNFVSKDFNYRGGKVISSFSLPSYYENFSLDAGIKNDELNSKFLSELDRFKATLTEAA